MKFLFHRDLQQRATNHQTYLEHKVDACKVELCISSQMIQIQGRYLECTRLEHDKEHCLLQLHDSTVQIKEMILRKDSFTSFWGLQKYAKEVSFSAQLGKRFIFIVRILLVSENFEQDLSGSIPSIEHPTYLYGSKARFY